MNKTLTINLNGMVFHIDQDAYEVLSAYINEVEKKFGKSPEGKEIVSDIEARIAELLSEKVSGNQIISKHHVEDIILVLGQPHDFDNIEEEEQPRSRKFRRLYRDMDRKVLGGVCSGLAYYIGVDIVLVRLGFVLALVLFGAGVLIYLLLWLVVPEAQTTAQKLEMRGEPVNLNSISNFINDEIRNIRSKMNL